MKKIQPQSFAGGRKKIFALSAGLLLGLTGAVGQQIFCVNGGTLAATAILGASPAHPTDVGIGTSNPQAKLHIGQGTYTTLQSYASPFPVDATKEGLLMQAYIVNTDNFRRYSDIVSLGYQNGSAGGSILRFLTNDKSSASAIERVRIDRNGLVGFGVTAPAYVVDVAGDVNLNTTSKAFRIGGNEMLWHNGNTNDIFVGYHAGNGTMTGHSNTLVGSEAGNSLSSSQQNTFVGYQSGKSATAYHNVGDPGNTALGYQSLYSNPDMLYNTAVGYQSMYNSSSCPLCWDGHSALNTAIGYQSLYNTSGYGGCALGYQAVYSNSTGCGTVGIGESAVHQNTTGNYNVAVGAIAMYGNTTLHYNVAVGAFALQAQSYNGNSNSYNVALGYEALYSNQPTSSSNGIWNTGSGTFALYSNTTGTSVTGHGYKAGYNNTTGNKNTFLGSLADANAGTYSNCGAIGYNTVVTANNKIFMGDGNLTGCYNFTGTWGAYSDGRFKNNVTEDVKGLEFINKLRPVTYNLDTKRLSDFLHANQKQDSTSQAIDDDYSASTARVHSGFIAQEVEKAAKDCGFNSSIVGTPASSNDPYTLSYGEIVVPLVKAVQQLDAANKQLQAQLSALQEQVNGCCSGHTENGIEQSEARKNAVDVTLSSKSIVLDQNQPNPFREQTTINYFIPDDAQNVKIIFTDSQGHVIREVQIAETGSGQLNVYAQDLSTGTYTYTLVANGATIDSKKMVCNK